MCSLRVFVEYRSVLISNENSHLISIQYKYFSTSCCMHPHSYPFFLCAMNAPMQLFYLSRSSDQTETLVLPVFDATTYSLCI